MSETPIQRHPNCTNPDCRTCFDDAMELQSYLASKIGGNHDFLGMYRSWLDKNGIPAETEHGWPTSETYKLDNIAAFVEAKS